MRSLLWLFAAAGTVMVAQQPSPTGFGRMINPSGVTPMQGGAGFGRMIYPSTGGAPAVQRTPVRPLTPNASRTLGAPPPIAHGNHQRGVIIPYPVYYGGYYYGYDAPAAPAPEYGYDPNAYAYDPNAAGQPSPVVIINQNFRPETATPVIHDYSNVQLPPPANQPQDQSANQAPAPDSSSIIFLIAMKDHTIYPALAYWVENNTLNYITTQGVHNSASLDLVDRDFSSQLNSERHIDFALPAAK